MLGNIGMKMEKSQKKGIINRINLMENGKNGTEMDTYIRKNFIKMANY